MNTESVDLAASVTQAGITVRPKGRSASSTLPLQIAILCGLFALAVLLQIASGAYRAEFSAYPDEPAHYVTSLMLREYIVHPHPLSPMKFAEAYYHHYPKVAFGHWPPLFYVVQAFWMLLFSASRISIRLEVAFTTALLAFSLWREGRRWFGKVPALLAACLLVCLPLMQNSTDEEMAETLLVLCCFWSTIFFGRFLESGKLSDSLWFGLFFSLAVLTKGSGWMLVLLPPIALLLTRQVKLLLKGSFWLGILLIAFLCLPWQIATLHSAERGWANSSPSLAYTFNSLVDFFALLVSVHGVALSLVIALGIVITVFVPLLSRPVAAVPAVFFGLLVSDWLFHSLVPAGVEDRKMIMAVPALIYFLFVGGFWLADRLPLSGQWASWRRPLLTSAAALFFFVHVFSVPRDSHYGYIEAAGFISSDPALRTSSLLVSSGSIGEGLLISEVAMRKPDPEMVILRATKELAHVDWAGVHYENLFSNPAELLRYLDRSHVTALVIDSYHGPGSFPHERLVSQTIKENAQRFHLRAEFPGRSDSGEPGKVEIYQFAPPQ